MPCHIFLRENKASIILATAWNLCSEATIFSLQAEIFIKSRTVQLCQGHDFQTAPATRLHGHVYQVAFVEGDLSTPEAQKACVYCFDGLCVGHARLSSIGPTKLSISPRIHTTNEFLGTKRTPVACAGWSSRVPWQEGAFFNLAGWSQPSGFGSLATRRWSH